MRMRKMARAFSPMGSSPDGPPGRCPGLIWGGPLALGPGPLALGPGPVLAARWVRHPMPPPGALPRADMGSSPDAPPGALPRADMGRAVGPGSRAGSRSPMGSSPDGPPGRCPGLIWVGRAVGPGCRDPRRTSRVSGLRPAGIRLPDRQRSRETPGMRRPPGPSPSRQSQIWSHRGDGWTGGPAMLSGLKARSIPARGNAPGMESVDDPEGLKARPIELG